MDVQYKLGETLMLNRYLPIAATVLSLTLSQAMAAGEQLQLIQDAEQLKTALAGEPVILTPQIVSITIMSSSDKMFPSGDWQLPTNATVLDKMLPTLSKFHTTKVVVRGYTDNVPIGQPLQAKGVTDNLDLSARRAMSVVRYLVAHGVNADILSAQAFGQTNPVASNDTSEGQGKNRRVEIRPSTAGQECPQRQALSESCRGRTPNMLTRKTLLLAIVPVVANWATSPAIAQTAGIEQAHPKQAVSVQ
jgi:chemotaxis protein MotB